jgi:hypothetical protein
LTSTTVTRAGLLGGNTGPLLLTNRRVIWYEDATGWPLKPQYGEVKLSDVVSIDEGNIVDLLSGGGLRFRFRNRKSKSVPFNGDNLGEWITEIRELIAEEANPEA